MKNVFVIAMESEADAVLRHLSDILRFEECGRTVYQGLLNGEQTAVRHRQGERRGGHAVRDRSFLA